MVVAAVFRRRDRHGVIQGIDLVDVLALVVRPVVGGGPVPVASDLLARFRGPVQAQVRRVCVALPLAVDRKAGGVVVLWGVAPGDLDAPVHRSRR